MPRFVNFTLFSQLRNWGLRFSVTILATLGGLLGTVLLFHQNQLLQKQNEKIDSQIRLEEASRRGSLIFMMGSVLDEIDEELDDPKNTKRELSHQLIGRISSLSFSFKPYKYFEGDSLIKKQISPERGQLFLALLNSQINPSTFRTCLKI